MRRIISFFLIVVWVVVIVTTLTPAIDFLWPLPYRIGGYWFAVLATALGISAIWLVAWLPIKAVIEKVDPTSNWIK